MKKLFRLREWLTVDEAARHLTSVLEEEVGPADILRMGLEGHIWETCSPVLDPLAVREHLSRGWS